MPVSRWHAELAWLGADTVAERVLIEAVGDRLVAVTPDTPAASDARRLSGLTIPGLVNAHSHAFHRALRGLTSAGAGDFWAWRRQMYEVAGRLDPDSYYELARATYAEMALAGITTVGEFHYLHHAPGGAGYDDPNAMGRALIAAAAAAGVRLTLVDACYLCGGLDGSPLVGPQLRFGDGDAAGWADRLAALPELAAPGGAMRIGTAIHSVRAVPAGQFGEVVALAEAYEAPLHLHLSEQPAENADCLAASGRTPTELCANHGVLGSRTTAVHATHLLPADIARLGEAGTGVCVCPTTERELADGIGPVPELLAAGCRLALGSDSQAVIDLLEEARAVEHNERLRSLRRGTHSAATLLAGATLGGAAALGWPDAGRLVAGGLADFTTVRLDSPRTAGAQVHTALPMVIFAANATDVTDVVVGGVDVVRDSCHCTVEDVGAALTTALAALRH
jgi:formiminoglutamate deiminase